MPKGLLLERALVTNGDLMGTCESKVPNFRVQDLLGSTPRDHLKREYPANHGQRRLHFPAEVGAGAGVCSDGWFPKDGQDTLSSANS